MHADDARATLDGDQVRRHRTAGTLRRHVAAGQLPDAALAREAGQQRHAEFGEALQLRQQFQVVLQGLAETETGVDDDPALVDARHLAGEDALGEEAVHVGDDVVVLRRRLHRARLAEHVHQHHRHAEFGRRVQRAFAAQRVHIVEHAGASGDRRAHDLRLAGVDADRHGRARGQTFDHRQHPPQLLLHRHLVGARTGGLATDVEQVGALFHQTQAMGDGRLRVVVATAIGKRIRGDVDDAHDPRAVEQQRAAGAVKAWGGVEHGASSRRTQPPL